MTPPFAWMFPLGHAGLADQLKVALSPAVIVDGETEMLPLIKMQVSGPTAAAPLPEEVVDVVAGAPTTTSAQLG